MSGGLPVALARLMLPCRLRLALTSLCLVACGSEPGGDDVPPDLTPDPADDGCSPLFAQGRLPEYRITLADAEWAALEDEFLNRPEREAAGLDPEPYHPVALRYVDGVDDPVDVPNVLLRLKGASSWLQTIALDPAPKMQFVIAFNEIDPEARFRGVRKVELDMPRTDQTFIHQRLALHYLRTAGTYAQCANNARLVINGTYYGLYTHLERQDKEFIQRHFPEADDGDLWKGGRIIKTNEETFSWDRVDALWHDADTPEELDALADLDASLYEWAAEAVGSHADGYYNGRANFYLYDHPARGFIWIPNDLDTAFDRDFLPVESSPLFPLCAGRWEPDWRHYLMLLADPTWLERYIAELYVARSHLDVAAMQERIDTWTKQIASAAADDPHRPFTLTQHELAVDLTRSYVGERAAFVDAWLACRDQGGGDDDGDGFVWCMECDDTDPAVRPGATEVCNGRDDDCDGRIDDGAACP